MRHLKIRLLVVIVVLAVLLLSHAFAQSFRGSIRGTVTDQSGGVLPNTKVTAKNIATGLQREANTGPDGGYVIAELPAGEYTVTAQAAQLSPAAQKVEVNVGVDTTANFDLTGIQKVTQQIVVTAENVPLVETSRDVLGQIVERQLVNELPLNGRDFGKLVALVPGTTVDPSGVAGTESGFGQFNINGNRDRSNNYTLDGTDNNDPFFNNSALNQTGIGGAPASLLPVEAIQEFNLQSQFAAEYGRNSGSVVNIITRSGTNQLHGSAYGFLRNSGFDARNFFDTESHKSVFQNSSFGASLGGPIVKDKTFFFGTYEGERENVGSDFLLQVPTQSEISQARTIAQGINPGGIINPGLDAVLSFYPQSNVNQIPSVVQDTNNGDYLIAKVDHSISNNELLTGRYAFARNYQVFPFGSPGDMGQARGWPRSHKRRRRAFRFSRSACFPLCRLLASTKSASATAATPLLSVRSMPTGIPRATASTSAPVSLACPNSTSRELRTWAPLGTACRADAPARASRSWTISPGSSASIRGNSAASSGARPSAASTTIWSAVSISSRPAWD